MKKRLGLSVLSGMLLGFSWPATGGATPFVFFAFVPLLLVQDQLLRKNKQGMFAYAYLAFFIWNLLATWWIYCVSESLLTKLVSAGSAILINPFFMAVVFSLCHFTARKAGRRMAYLAFLTFWIAFEYIHLNWDLSYPWLTVGNVFSNEVRFVQWYEYTGVFGGTLWVLGSNLMIFHLIDQTMKRNRKWKAWGMALCLWLLIPVSVSVIMYDQYVDKGEEVNVVVVQPNIDPYNEKFSGMSAAEQLNKFLQLARGKISDSIDYIVGPETALPGNIWTDLVAEAPMYKHLKKYIASHPRSAIVLGASMGKIYQSGEDIPPTARKARKGDYWYDFFNSAIQIDTTSRVQYYHKSKLVLGVEKMPFPSFFKHFQDAIFDMGGTTGSLGIQKERAVFVSPSRTLKIAPVICWESVYGEYVGEYVNKGAQLIFVMTNDGWWDDTPGYKQHFAYARLRAIESRRSVVRSANTGISCFIDQKGEVLKQTKWWEATAIQGTLKANNAQTFYTENGDYIARIASFVACLLLVISVVKTFILKTNRN